MKPWTARLLKTLRKLNKRNHWIRRILLADDSTVARKQVQRAIESIGFEVISVKDGKSLWEAEFADVIEGSIPDQISLVISDIEMPEMDGYTLTAEIRRHAEAKRFIRNFTLIIEWCI